MSYYHQASFTQKQLKDQMMFITILSYKDLSLAVCELCHDGKQNGNEYKSHNFLPSGVWYCVEWYTSTNVSESIASITWVFCSSWATLKTEALHFYETVVPIHHIHGITSSNMGIVNIAVKTSNVKTQISSTVCGGLTLKLLPLRKEVSAWGT